MEIRRLESRVGGEEISRLVFKPPIDEIKQKRQGEGDLQAWAQLPGGPLGIEIDKEDAEEARHEQCVALQAQRCGPTLEAQLKEHQTD